MVQLAKLKKRIHSLTFYVCAVSMFILIPMMLLKTGDIIGRAAMARPVPGAMELSKYMLAVFILLGLAYTQQIKGHPSVTFVTSRFSGRVQGLLGIIVGLLSLFIVAIMIWQGWTVAFEQGSIVSDMLRIPQLPFRLLVCGGGLLLFLELLIDLGTFIAKLVRGQT